MQGHQCSAPTRINDKPARGTISSDPLELDSCTLEQLSSDRIISRFPVEFSWTIRSDSSIAMSGTEDLNARAAAGETVVPGGKGGKSVEAQQHLAEGRSKGGQTRSEQLGHDGYVEMGKKGGSATADLSGGAAAEAAGRPIDDSKFSN